MSEVRDAVLDAIDAGACTSAAIIEATGLENNQVHQACWQLKSAGIITKGADGFVRNDGAPPPKRRIHEAVEPPAASEQPKRTRKVNGKAKTVPAAVPAPIHAGNGAAPPVSFARFGEYVVLRTADLADLADLVARIERWRPIVELARKRTDDH